MLPLFLAVYLLLMLGSGLCQSEKENTTSAVCDALLQHSCNLAFQIDQSQLRLAEDTCNIFFNVSPASTKEESNFMQFPFGVVLGYRKACSRNLVLNISNQIKNFSLQKINFDLLDEQKNSHENIPNECDFPLIEIWERAPFSSPQNSNNSRSKLSRNSRHVPRNVGRRRAKSSSKHFKHSLRVLRRQQKQCKQLQLFLAENRRRNRKKRRRKSLLAKKMRRFARKLQSHCSKVNKKRNLRNDVEENRTELIQPFRNRSGPRPRNTRSLPSNEWVKSIELCLTDDPNGSLTLYVHSKGNTNIKRQRFFGSIAVSGGESVIKFNISWFQNKSDGSARIVFQFFNRPNVTTSISASFTYANGEVSTPANSSGNLSRTSDAKSKNEHSVTAVICVLSVFAFIAIVVAFACYLRRRHKPMQDLSITRNNGSGDIDGESISLSNSREMVLQQIRSSKRNKNYVKNLCHQEIDHQRNNNNMPACPINNNRPSSFQRSSCKKSSRKKKHTTDYNSATQSEKEVLKSKSSEKQQFEAFSNLSGSSYSTTAAFNNKFLRRANNNPNRRDIPHSTLGQRSQFHYPPPIRRYPARATGAEITKSASQLNSDPNRFQTPPNRTILSNDGNQIISRCQDQFFIQSESGSCTLTNSAPPCYSPLSGSSRTYLNNEVNYIVPNQDSPPEYSEPPDYYP